MDLPDELLLTIFGFLDDHNQGHFARLIRVSRLFKSLVEPLLYREVVFRDIYSATRRLQQFRERITSQPDRRFAKYVESYTTVDPSSLSAILPELVELRRLKFHCIESMVDFSQPFFPLMQLTHLHCHCEVDAATFAHFLESQQSLEYLYFSAAVALTLSPDALPRLRSLSTVTQGVLSILPGRHIDHLAIHDLERFSAHVSAYPSTFESVYSLYLQFEGVLDGMISAVLSFPNTILLGIEDRSRSAPYAHMSDHHIFHDLASTKVQYISLRLAPSRLMRFFSTNNSTGNSYNCAPFFQEMPDLFALDLGMNGGTLGLRCTLIKPDIWPIERPRLDLGSWSLWWQHDLQR